MRQTDTSETASAASPVADGQGAAQGPERKSQKRTPAATAKPKREEPQNCGDIEGTRAPRMVARKAQGATSAPVTCRSRIYGRVDELARG